MQRGRFSSSAEYIVYSSRGVPTEGEKSPQNVLQFQPVPGEEKAHIAQKPVALMEALIGLTQPNALIVDPFMGAGTTGVAAVSMGRRFVGVEMSVSHFDTACRRIEDMQRQIPLWFEPA